MNSCYICGYNTTRLDGMNHHVKAKHKDEFCLRSLWFHNKFTTVLKIKVRAQDTRWMCPNISEVKVNQVRCDCLLCVSMICDWNIQSLSKAKYNSMVNTSSRHKVSSTKVENSPWTLWVKGKGVHCSPTLGLVYQIQNAPVKQGDNAPNASKCYKPMKGMWTA